MLATSKNVLFPGHKHLLTTGADNLTLYLLPEHQRGYLVDSRFFAQCKQAVSIILEQMLNA